MKKSKWSPTAMQVALVGKAIEAKSAGIKMSRNLAVEAGYEPGKSAGNAVQSLKNNKYLREYMRTLAEERGLTPELVIDKVVEGLGAMTVKTATIGGKITDEKAFPDYATRKGYVDTSIELLHMKPEREDAPNTMVNVLAIITDMAHLSEDEIRGQLQAHRERQQLIQHEAQAGTRRRSL